MTIALEKLEGEDLEVAIHPKPACLIELHVKVGKKILNEAKREAIKAVNKEVELPGFRKGKAPDQTILKRYGQEVERQIPKMLANAAYEKAQKLAKVPLLNHNAQITFDLKERSEEKAELVFSFETEPKVPEVDPKLFAKKPVAKAEVGEKQIDEAVRQMRFFFAEWKSVEDRPIQDGDYIMINLDTIEEGNPVQVFHEVRFEVSKERMASWMQKLVQGAKSGDVLDGISEPDDDASEEEKKEFKPKQVKLAILKVEEAELPELNDDFAKKVGAETVEKMRESIAKMLETQAEEKVQEELHEQVNSFLVAQYPFDLPHSLVQTEQKHRKQQWLKDPEFQEKWDTELSTEEKSRIEEKWHTESERAIRLFYLAKGIVRQGNLSITHQEVQNEAIVAMRSFTRVPVEPDKIPKEVFALALSRVILAKAENYIIQQAS